MIRALLALGLGALLLAGCASPKYVVSDVTAYAEPGGPRPGSTFAVVPVDDVQRESLAFKQAAGYLAARLSAAGLTAHTGTDSAPDLIATLVYSVDGPSGDTESRFSAGVGFGYYRDPFYGYGHSPFGPDYRDMKTYQAYVRRVEVSLYDGATYGTDNARKLYEVQGMSEGRGGQVEPVLPYILEGMLQNFPAGQGKPQRVRVEVPEGADLLDRGTPPSIRSRE